ncbi:hypothetical protein ACIOHE_15860 [Streptomyces sp. NPDC087851]|uniref:hypothetical protein n=1 Tax=Streptomyces sp. NPDC087851 TaxID=3365810 RepID=UPI003813CFA9
MSSTPGQARHATGLPSFCGVLIPQKDGAPPLPCWWYARLYPCGWCCQRHTPAARAGRPESPPGPGWPSAAWTTPLPIAAGAVIDERAIASGKRRSSQHVYRAAQAAEENRKR